MAKTRGSYNGGSTVITTPRKPGWLTLRTARLKEEFLLHPTAQFVMSFPKYKNLRQKGLRPQDINAATKIDDNSFKKRHKKAAKTPEQIEARNRRLARFKIRNRKEIARKKREEASDEPRRKFKINMDLSVYRVSPE